MSARSLVAVALSTLLTAPLLAHADAQFMVPYNIKNANPKIAKMGVGCRLLSAANSVLAGGESDFPLANGVAQGTANVSVKFDGPTNTVKSWQCYFTAQMSDGSSTSFAPDASPPVAYLPLAGSKTSDTGNY